MIFERLADVIWKRSKLIVAIWIILLICAVPGILKAGDVLDYGTDNMAGPDAESIRGAEIMGEYFGDSSGTGVSMDTAALLIISFNTAQGKINALAAGKALSPDGNGTIPGYVDGDNNQKIQFFTLYGVFTAEDIGTGTADKGVAVYALIYDNEIVPAGDVSSDTVNLRGYLNGVISDKGLTEITAYVSGSPAITFDTSEGAAEDISKIDIFSILMILILVGLFFRSFVTSAMPPMTIGAAFGITMCLMFLVGSIMNIMYMTEMILLVSMLGAGCDYCIFILARYREERVRHGADHEQALKSAVTWAGESITTSGLAVIIGFGAMSICSFSMISSMGIMLAIGIVIALLAALTLISSVLALLGGKLFWPTKAESLREGGKADLGWHGKVSRIANRYFLRSAKFSIKHAKIIILAAVLCTVPAAYIMATSESSYDMVGAMATGEAIDGLEELEIYSNGGMISPNYAVFELTGPIGTVTQSEGTGLGSITWNTEDMRYLYALTGTDPLGLYGDSNAGEVWGIYVWSQMVTDYAARHPEIVSDSTVAEIYRAVAAELPASLGKQVTAAVDPVVTGYSQMIGTPPSYDDLGLASVMDYIINFKIAASVGGENGSLDLIYVKYTLITKDEAMSDRSMDTIRFMDDKVSAFAENSAGLISEKWLTGSAVVMYEISEQVSSEFLKVEILAIALIFVLLFFVMRSYVTPARSILTILMSVVWTVAMTHILFGSLQGEGVIWMIPIILIVVCLGLGMDYDILLTTRIKENRMHKGMSNDEAITHAVTHSGSVITICGLIMGGAFGTLMLSGTTMLQEFGFALCFAIIVDALLVRTYVVPAAMHLLGDLNWKGPRFLHRNVPERPE